MKKLVIFDLDGTLLNTIEDLGHAANYALEKHGYATLSMASYPFFVGNGVRRLIERVLPEDARRTDIVEALLKDFKVYYDEHDTEFTHPYDGIPELLDELRARDVKLAVASNKYQRAVNDIIGHFFGDHDFVAIVGQNEGIPVKPDPSIVFQILAKAHLPKSEVLYVGDSGIDMETARRACLDSVGVTWGFRPEKELNEYHASIIVNRPADILEVVEKGILL